MRPLIIAAVVVLAAPGLAEVKRKVDENGVTLTMRVGSDITMAGRTEDSGRIAQSLYFRGQLIATFIGWTKEAQAAANGGRLFQRRLLRTDVKEGETIRLHYAFLRRAGGLETFQIAREGEIIDAYFVSADNQLTALTDEEFKKYREERAASRE